MKTKFYEKFKKFTAWVVISQILLGFMPVFPAYAKVEDKISICHQIGKDSDVPLLYNSQSVSANAADESGHGGHNLDIIPAFTYKDVSYAGRNWPSGMATWLNNCNETASLELSVLYDPNGSTGGTVPFDGLIYDAGDTVTVMSNSGLLTKTGFEFTGWNTMADGSGTNYDPGDTFNITNNIILYAKWSVETFLVNFDTDGGSPTPADQTVSYGGHVDEPSDPSKTGYTFVGWYEDEALMDPWLFASETVTEDMTLYAKWDINQYGVYFDSDGGSLVAPIILDYGSVVNSPDPPTKTGYTFVGWDGLIPSTMPAYNTYLTATWEINQYQVEVLVSGLGNAYGGGTYPYNSTVELSAVPQLGWHFAGWTGDCDGTINPYTILSLASNMSCTANFEINTYNVFFDTNLGTPMPPYQIVDYGGFVLEPIDPFLAGHTFDAWCDITLTSPWNFVTDTVTEEMTLYARYTTNEYTVNFDSMGGTVVASGQVLYGENVPEPTDPSKMGNTFVGWYEEPECTNLWDFDLDLVLEDITLYACWDVDEYTIYFDSAGGTLVDSITEEYGEAIIPPADPTREGYAFAGWVPGIPVTMPAHDTYLVADWNINVYTIYFDSAGGTPVGSIAQNYGTAVTQPTDPTREGYTFVEWSPAVPAVMPAHDSYVTASWKINQYTINFDSNGGSSVSSITQDYGTVVVPPPDPTRGGYTFGNWSPPVPVTMPSYDLVLVANWIENPIVVPAPVILTPIIPAAPVVAAAPAVAAAVDEPEAEESQEVAALQDEPVLGSSDKVCPWWWIIGLILLASLAFTGGVVRAEKDDSLIRKYYYAWPPLFSAIAFVAHYYLHQGFKATWFCENYWLLMIVAALIGELAFRALRKKKDKE